MFYVSSSGKIELQLTRAESRLGYHSGQCDDDIDRLRMSPRIARQLKRLDEALVRDELREWGAWDETELSDHDANLSRLLWLACADIVEQEWQSA